MTVYKIVEKTDSDCLGKRVTHRQMRFLEMFQLVLFIIHHILYTDEQVACCIFLSFFTRASGFPEKIKAITDSNNKVKFKHHCIE